MYYSPNTRTRNHTPHTLPHHLTAQKQGAETQNVTHAKWVECFDTTDNRGQGLRAIRDISKTSMPDLVYYGQYYHNEDTKDAHPLAKHSTYVLGSNSTGFYDGAAIPHQLATKLNHAPTRTQKNRNLPRHANCKIY